MYTYKLNVSALHVIAVWLTLVCCVPQGSRDYFGITILWSHRHVVPRLCDRWTFSGLAPLSRGSGIRPGKQPSTPPLFGCRRLSGSSFQAEFELKPSHVLSTAAFFLLRVLSSQHFWLLALTSMTHFLLFKRLHMESSSLPSAFFFFSSPKTSPVPICALIPKVHPCGCLGSIEPSFSPCYFPNLLLVPPFSIFPYTFQSRQPMKEPVHHFYSQVCLQTTFFFFLLQPCLQVADWDVAPAVEVYSICDP